MATAASIASEMHAAFSASGLDALKAEADVMAAAHPEYLQFFRSQVYREYNKKKALYFNNSGIITPYDGGYTPYSYTP
jgi:hypothetical protein